MIGHEQTMTCSMNMNSYEHTLISQLMRKYNAEAFRKLSLEGHTAVILSGESEFSRQQTSC